MVSTRASDLQAIDLASARRTLRAPELVRSLRNCHDAIARWTSADAYGTALADGTRTQLLAETDALLAAIMG